MSTETRTPRFKDASLPVSAFIRRTLQFIHFAPGALLCSLALISCSDKNPDFIADAMFGEKDVSIHITSPVGNSEYKRGTRLSITWIALPRFDDVDILIVRGTAVAATITSQLPDYRQLDYTIPTYLTDAYDYRIRIIGHREDYSIQAESDKFRIY